MMVTVATMATEAAVVAVMAVVVMMATTTTKGCLCVGCCLWLGHQQRRQL
jgi:hypothetical protein